ncbi:GNAT family N-acetyltransferase [Roseomonas chloroacetimidivorans]|uniref:GNAT family N-acetyltransferase n=1 Tax=Roseomonas chloroacetimidivorans TaxID=1766656 RepID=UPI003C70E88D
MTIRVIETVSEFESQQSEWNQLAACSRSPLLRHEFFSACLGMDLRDRTPMIFVASEQGKITAIAPLERVHHAGVHRLQAIGRDLHEPYGFLFRSQDALREVMHAVRESRHPLLLSRVAAGQAEEQTLRDVSRLGDVLIGRDGGTSPYISLSDGFGAFNQRLSSTRRADLRRKRRRAERMGPVVVEAASPALDDVDAYMGRFLQLEASGWKGSAGSAILLSGKESFFRPYARTLAAQGKLRMFFLSIAGVDAAARMAIQHDNWLWELKIAYNESLHQCSPGMLLTYETIQHACKEGLAGLEFLGLVAAWNDFWGIQKRPHSTIRYYPRGFRSSRCIMSDAWMAAQRFRAGWKARGAKVPALAGA